MNFVVDASVAIKWFLQEPDSARAVALSRQAAQIHAPDLLLAEIANVAWKEAIRKRIAADQARAIAAHIRLSPIRFVPIAALQQRALEIALEVNHSVYDCLYLACAERHEVFLITADKTLMNKTRSSAHAGLVWHLGDPSFAAFDGGS